MAEDERGTDRDYWIAPVAGSRIDARRLGVQRLLRQRKLPVLEFPWDCPQDWINNRLLFRVSHREPLTPITSAIGTENVFQVPLSPPDWLPSGNVEALQPILTAGHVRVAKNPRWIVFTAERNTRSIWSLGLPAGKPAIFSRAIQDPAIRAGFDGTWPGLSGNGNVVCAAIERYAKPDILCKDLNSGTEKLLGAEPSRDSPALPNGDGGQVAYLRSRHDQSDLVIRDVSTGREQVMGSGCPVLFQWAADGSSFLCSEPSDPVATLYRIAVPTGQKTPLLTLRTAPKQAQVSPDGLWLALVVAPGQPGSRPNGLLSGNVISLKENPNDISRWITVAEERYDLSLHWAPDGNSIYFWQIRDGHRCLWGQRLDASTKRPTGTPFPVLHRHTFQAYPLNGGTLAVAGSADRLRFAMTLSDDLSNLWRVSFLK